ncbi:MAG: ribonuclease HII [Parcubacteria group bacterium Greene0416_79]|nr:MAG: ribonuclease HII [Parcubacteria group bacterium Greene0416_79]
MRREFLVGIDEVGRGPLAGPLCVGACLIRARDRRRVLARVWGIRDSKRLAPKRRIAWCLCIEEMAAEALLTLVTSFVSHKVIDRMGIAQALRIAIRRCLAKLAAPPERVEILLDGGIAAPALYPFQKTIIGGDETEPLITLASIVAKVRRDRRMARLARKYPAYGFERHKGYGTKRHYEALRKYGTCPIHRLSFLKKFIGQLP